MSLHTTKGISPDTKTTQTFKYFNFHMQIARSYVNKQLDGLCGNFDDISTNEGCKGGDCIASFKPNVDNTIPDGKGGFKYDDGSEHKKAHFDCDKSNLPDDPKNNKPDDQKW